MSVCSRISDLLYECFVNRQHSVSIDNSVFAVNDILLPVSGSRLTLLSEFYLISVPFETSDKESFTYLRKQRPSRPKQQ